jgi:hypothetical protein
MCGIRRASRNCICDWLRSSVPARYPARVTNREREIRMSDSNKDREAMTGGVTRE